MLLAIHDRQHKVLTYTRTSEQQASEPFLYDRLFQRANAWHWHRTSLSRPPFSLSHRHTQLLLCNYFLSLPHTHTSPPLSHTHPNTHSHFFCLSHTYTPSFSHTNTYTKWKPKNKDWLIPEQHISRCATCTHRITHTYAYIQACLTLICLIGLIVYCISFIFFSFYLFESQSLIFTWKSSHILTVG